MLSFFDKCYRSMAASNRSMTASDSDSGGMDDLLNFDVSSDDDDEEARTLTDSFNQMAGTFPDSFAKQLKFSTRMFKGDCFKAYVKHIAQGCLKDKAYSKDDVKHCTEVITEMVQWFLRKNVDERSTKLNEYCLFLARWAVLRIFGKCTIPTTEAEVSQTIDIYPRMVDLRQSKDEWSKVDEFLRWFLTAIKRYSPIKPQPTLGCLKRTSTSAALPDPDTILKTKKARMAPHPDSDRKSAEPKGKNKGGITTNLKNLCTLWLLHAYHLLAFFQKIDYNDRDDVSALLATVPRPFTKMVTVCLPEDSMTEWVEQDTLETRDDPIKSQLTVSAETNIAKLATRFVIQINKF